MLEKKLSKSAEEVIGELHALGVLLKPETVRKLEEAIILRDSWLMVLSGARRFVIGLAAVLVAIGSVVNFWPFGGSK